MLEPNQHQDLNITSLNLFIFVRIQQNACSSSIEVMDFGSETHWEKERNYIENIIKPLDENFTLASNKTSYSQNNNLVLLLNTNNTTDHFFDRLNNILEKCLSIDIYIIRHEGDFPINGTKVDCDCNNCLASSIFTKLNYLKLNESLKFHNITPIEYHNGYQYSILNYKTSLTEKHHAKYICKKQISNTITFKYLADKEIYKNHSNDSYEKYKKIGSPKYVAAPMIGQSELAFRMMARKHGAQLCYTPMINAEIFVTSLEYQQELFTTVAEDRPLIAQFAGNNLETLLKAIPIVADQCDYIDINLGCPQPIARRHYYGAWLMEDQDTIYTLIKSLTDQAKKLRIPISCKIRIFESIQDTIKYAQMLEKAGCSLLTIHGRERKSSMNLEPANWEHIKEIKKYVNIPIIANGSIDSLETAEKCLNLTKCDAVMAASHLLENPYLFSNKESNPNVKSMALEYLEFAKTYNALPRYAKAHVLQMFSNKISSNILDEIKSKNSIEELNHYVNNLEENYFLDKKERSCQNTFDLVSQASSTIASNAPKAALR